nr:MAG TPA: hypothetical protein [Caudoviricetes sp.]
MKRGLWQSRPLPRPLYRVSIELAIKKGAVDFGN